MGFDEDGRVVARHCFGADARIRYSIAVLIIGCEAGVSFHSEGSIAEVETQKQAEVLAPEQY
jgi:hypothetical protein